MPGNSSPGVGPSLVDAVKTAAEDMVDLIGAQIHLARVEVVNDIGAAARRWARLGIFLPLLLGGYGFAVAALAYALSGPLGVGGGLGVVALGQLLVGGVGLFVTQRGGRPVKLLERSGAEASASVSQVVTAISAQHRQDPMPDDQRDDQHVRRVPSSGKDPSEQPRKATPHVE